MATVRNESYAAYAWPRFLSGVFVRNGMLITQLTALSVAGFIVGFVALADPETLWSRNAGDFYRVMPHGAMVALFGAVSLYAILAFVLSLRAFWRDIRGDEPIGMAAFLQALGDVMTLRYLGGGGGGCTSENEKPSAARRVYHHFTFYGFLLCFASTTVATLYHYAFGWRAPYPLTSLPVLFGIVGGIGLLIGPAGLFALSFRREATLTDPSHRGMDTAFIVMLFLTSLTGFALMIWRDSAAMGLLLAVHLGVVFALFLSLPYGKFVHGFYRLLALIKYAGERRKGTFVD
jgi:citrate/tricarballylate utilization protein